MPLNAIYSFEDWRAGMTSRVSQEMTIPSAAFRRDGEHRTRLSELARHPSIWIALAFTAALLLAGFYYALIQNIWIDESTQLSGATLGPGGVLSWLAGTNAGRFGVPPDRMPPLSYLLDSICAHTICGAPYDFRLFHLMIVASGLFALLDLIGRRYGAAAACVGGIILALSPRLIDTSVEIRAYPILFAITCFQLRSFYELANSRELRASQMSWFFVLGILAIYTHFFGLVSTMALIVGLFACRVRMGPDLLRVSSLAAAMLICSVGLYPFITSAAQISGAEHSATGTGELVGLLPRVVAHPATMVSRPVAILFFASLSALFAVSLGRLGSELYRSPLQERKDPLVGVVIAFLSGLAVTILASRLMHGFDALKPSYSGWMLPFIALIASAALAQSRWWKWLLLATLVGCSLSVEYIFLSNARFFVHGPEHSINEAMGQDAESVSVIYVGSDWAYGYFPIWYQHGGRVAQWQLGDDGKLRRITKGGGVDRLATPWNVLGSSKRVVLVAIQTRSFESLRAPDPGIEESLASAASLVQPHVPDMRLVAAYGRPGIYWSELAIFRKAQ